MVCAFRQEEMLNDGVRHKVAHEPEILDDGNALERKLGQHVGESEWDTYPCNITKRQPILSVDLIPT